MTLSVKNVKCYKYSENDQMNAISIGSYPTIKKMSAKDENGTVDSMSKNVKQTSRSVISDDSGKALSTQENESYLIGDKLYTKTDGQWIESNVSDPVKAFGERDKLISLVGLIRSSDIESISTEVIDGQKCYKLEIKPEQNTAVNLLKDQALEAYSTTASPLPEISSKDLSDSNALLDNSNMSYTVWITTAYIPKMMNSKTKLTLTPASLLGGSDRTPNFRINAIVDDRVLFTDFNVPERIGTPEGAGGSA